MTDPDCPHMDSCFYILCISGFACMDGKWNLIFSCFCKKRLVIFCWKECLGSCKIDSNYAAIFNKIFFCQLQSFQIFFLVKITAHTA